MEPITESAELEQNALLLKIHPLAHRIARRRVKLRHLAEDVAQDVVLDCLVRLREGTWSLGNRTLEGHIRCLVRRRAKTVMRQWYAQMERDVDHLRDREATVHAWMEPEVQLDAEELEALRGATLGGLSPMCRRAYELVRIERLSYQAAAHELGVAPATVKAHVIRAQRVFRTVLRGTGVVVPPEKAPGRRKPRWRRRRRRVA